MGSFFPNSNGETNTKDGNFVSVWNEFFRKLRIDLDGSSSGMLNVKYFGAIGDGVRDDSLSIQKAIDDCPAGGIVYIPSGVYLISSALLVRKSNISIIGSGSLSTCIKIKSMAGIAPTVLELGNCADGNDAALYDGMRVCGITFDGNMANTGLPVGDLTSWGMNTTKISNSTFHDLMAINCHTGGFGTFINSNHNKWSDIHVYNCGFALGHPGFDVNSSKYCTYSGVIVVDCNYGFRLLDNCWDNIVYVTIKNATIIGFVYNNQSVNESFGNIINATIYDGCSSAGCVVAAKCHSSQLNLTIHETDYIGLLVAAQVDPSNNSHSNTYSVSSRGCQGQSCKIETDLNIIDVISVMDGRSGAVGDNFAIDVSGSKNTIRAVVEDSAVWHVRGVAFRSGANDNTLLSYKWLNTADPLNDGAGGLRNSVVSVGLGSDIASQNTIDIPSEGSVFKLTGTNAVATITSGNSMGRKITLITTGASSLVDGSNLKLAGNFAPGGADSTITLVGDGTNWFEVCRSIN